MSQSNEYAVTVQETHAHAGRSIQYPVAATTPEAAVPAAMTAAGLVGHGIGRCLVRVYDAANDSHFPAGPVLLETHAGE